MSHAPSPKLRAKASLYERDLHAWSLEQARLLRDGRLAEIDTENIAEEILDVGKTEYRVLQSAFRVLLAHMLKWDHQPEHSRSWQNTILEQRDRIEEQLADNPSLKPRLAEAARKGYRAGRLRASGETDIDLDQFPEECPYDLEAIMNRAFKL